VGDYYQIIVDRDATSDEAEALALIVRNWLVSEGIIAAEMTDCVLGADFGHSPGPRHARVLRVPDDGLPGLRTNGLNIIVERQLFYGTPGDLGLVCASCEDLIDDGEEIWAVIDQWCAGDDSAEYGCPWCGHTELISEWTFDPPWGFGNLGFEFWNWPMLRPEFVDEVTRRLGHRTVLVSGKL